MASGLKMLNFEEKIGGFNVCIEFQHNQLVDDVTLCCYFTHFVSKGLNWVFDTKLHFQAEKI